MLANLKSENKSKNSMVQFIKYCFSGFLGTLVDYIIYMLLLNILGITIDISKIFSFIVGNFFSFTINKYFIFMKRTWTVSEIRRYIILTSLVLLTNVVVNSVTFYVTSNINISFLIALTAHLIVNFTGQKIWVFRIQ